MNDTISNAQSWRELQAILEQNVGVACYALRARP